MFQSIFSDIKLDSFVNASYSNTAIIRVIVKLTQMRKRTENEINKVREDMKSPEISHQKNCFHEKMEISLLNKTYR